MKKLRELNKFELNNYIFNNENINTLYDMEIKDELFRYDLNIICLYLYDKLADVHSNNICKNKIIVSNKFNINGKPKLILNKYISRIIKLSYMTYTDLMIVLCYLDNFELTTRNIYKIFLICSLVEKKFYGDFNEKNSEWSFIGGINLKDINNLELELLQLIDYKLNLSIEKFNSKIIELSKYALV